MHCINAPMKKMKMSKKKKSKGHTKKKYKGGKK
jgi:hypothetical protein